ncbi:MAG: hypothetical protein ACI4YA_08590 [Candidatus Spyradenecus sp.]
METKQKITLAIVGVLCGAAIIAMLVFLFMLIGQMSEAKQARDDAESTLTSYYNSERYPNEENRKVRQQDCKEYTQMADAARALLSHGLEIPQGETPSQFVTRIGESVRLLNERQSALKKGVLSTAKKASGEPEAVMDYAFGRYVVQGEMPADDGTTVPRLATQFAAIEHVCNLLLDRGALEITEVSRTVFEAAAQAKPEEEAPRTTRRGRKNRKTESTSTAADADALDPVLAQDGVSRESYTIRFRARYTTLATVLNDLVKSPLFVVVTDVAIARPVLIRDRVTEMVKKRETQRAVIARRAANARTEEERKAAEAAAAKPLFDGASPAERLVTDPAHSTPLEITLKFDVYSVPPAPEAAADEAAPAATEGN